MAEPTMQQKVLQRIREFEVEHGVFPRLLLRQDVLDALQAEDPGLNTESPGSQIFECNWRLVGKTESADGIDLVME